MNEKDTISQITKAVNKINLQLDKSEYARKIKSEISYLYEKLEKKLEKEELPERPPKEEISSELQKLLKERDEWRTKLDKLKDQKEKLISEGIMTEKMYKERHEEIMDQLVNIEDKIIQEKMKGGVKK